MEARCAVARPVSTLTRASCPLSAKWYCGTRRSARPQRSLATFALLRERAKAGASILMASHQLLEVEELCDEVLVLQAPGLITTYAELDRVLAGLAAAKRAGFAPVKVNAVAIRGSTDADVVPLNIMPGDAFLLCSDGWWDTFEPHDIAAALHRSDSPEEWLDDMRRHIAERAAPRPRTTCSPRSYRRATAATGSTPTASPAG